MKLEARDIIASIQQDLMQDDFESALHTLKYQLNEAKIEGIEEARTKICQMQGSQHSTTALMMKLDELHSDTRKEF